MNNHLEFCKKYPQTIEGYEDGINLLQYQIDNNIIPVVEYFTVGILVELYNHNPDIFSEYKDLKDDWNKLVKIKEENEHSRTNQ